MSLIQEHVHLTPQEARNGLKPLNFRMGLFLLTFLIPPVTPRCHPEAVALLYFQLW